MPELTQEELKKSESSFVWWLSGIATLAAYLPALYALLRTPAGSSYLGFEYNTDDHMVYAAWMRQAMDGHFFMDNRFTTDPQPALTVHLYFFVLGLIAKVIGIPLAASLGRAVFSVGFVHLTARFLRRLGVQVYGFKLALSLVVVGAGLGFMLWQDFGVDIDKPAPDFLSSFLLGHLPTDIWQPEGFVFPSMLTNGLFMVSLCLIVYAFTCFLDVRESKKPVLGGFLALAVLMNIHSYDVLTVALVMVGFLAAAISRKQITGPWLGRAVVIALGPVLPALWFWHVLQSDPVFQARAATETYSPNFRQVLFGYLLMTVLGFGAAWYRALKDSNPKRILQRQIGVGLAIALFVGLTVLAGTRNSGYFLSTAEWAMAFVVALVAVFLAADDHPAWNLVFSWAVIGAVAIYFPALFQRKLTMGLSVPWAILSASLIAALVGNEERYRRNLATILALVAMGASSLRWFFRDTEYIRDNVANTTRHPVYLSPDEQKILAMLNGLSGRNVLLALPGVGNQNMDQATGQPIPDSFSSPALPDLSPICSGLADVYTYAGHWSETPDYTKKAVDMYRFFFDKPFQSLHQVMSDQERAQFIADTGATYAILPTNSPDYPLIKPDRIGTVVYPGSQFELVKLNRP